MRRNEKRKAEVEYRTRTRSEKTLCCPNCGGRELSPFYRVEGVPTQSVLLMPSREDALNHPRGNITLSICSECSFVTNLEFDSSLIEYSHRYEETQQYSQTFNEFHRELAEHLTDSLELRNKHLLEIGCGKGEFLRLLCELGDNSGTGFDPAFVEGRLSSKARERIVFVQEFFSDESSVSNVDFLCCKMTLEHIPRTRAFLKMIKRKLDPERDPLTFFQVPNFDYVLQTTAFWDIYYEHCSYFSRPSLVHLFEQEGFEVLECWADFEDQYLMLTARLRRGALDSPGKDEAEGIRGKVLLFSKEAEESIQAWERMLTDESTARKKTVLWGAGSKAVAFLNTLSLSSKLVHYGVDVNPYKWNTFLAGTGQRIVSPDFMKEVRPDNVIVMNPIYLAEIKEDLEKRGLSPRLFSVTEPRALSSV